MEKLIYYHKGKLALTLIGVVVICSSAIFSGYLLFQDHFSYGHPSIYIIGVLFLLFVIKIVPALLSEKPAYRIGQRGFRILNKRNGTKDGWIGWDTVKALGRQSNFVTIVLKKPHDRKGKSSIFSNLIPSFGKRMVNIGPSYFFGISSIDLLSLFDGPFTKFKQQSYRSLAQENKQPNESDIGYDAKKRPDEKCHKIYGFQHASKGFMINIVFGPKNFKFTYSETLYRYDDIKTLKKTYHSVDPHYLGQLIDRIFGKLVPRLTIRMKDGSKIRIDHYISRKDSLEVHDIYQPSQAFNEIDAFLHSKMDEID